MSEMKSVTSNFMNGSIGGIGGLTNEPKTKDLKGSDLQGPSFKDILKSKANDVSQVANNAALKFSQHALERINSRGIQLTKDDVSRMEQAIGKAEQKGSRDTLVLMGDNAFIVNVKNKTVVTAMDRNLMKENVFTNIDSTVVL